MSFPITQVTVYEDRAQVRREGTVALESGVQTVEVDIAAVASDRSVQVLATGAEVLDVRIRRRNRTRPGPDADELDALRLRADRARRALEGANARLVELGAQHAAVQHLADILVSELSEAADAGRAVDGARLRDTLERMRQRSRVTLDELQAAHEELLRLTRDRTDLDTQLAELGRRETRRETVALVRLDLASEGEVSLHVDYLVPGAAWRPWHRARLVGDCIHVQTDACVWQRTGEDWSDVELRLSTERASLGVDVPSLSADTLSAHKVGSEVQVEVREQAREELSPGATRKAEQMGGIDDGGEPLTLGAATRAHIPADGRPTRIPLGSFEAPASSSLRCTGELAQAVVLRSEQTNTSGQPLLPGPVDLVRDANMVGRTWLDHVSPGARFELGWGPEVDLRMNRSVKEERKEARMLSSWRNVERTVTLKLSNVGECSHTLELVERVPVSEVEKVKIEVDLESTDEHGFVRWSVQLAPGETTERELRYRLKLHSDVSGV
jgi:uncharacterized protein (TIGR02231 family)